ncbi:MAG: hypothetical protein JXR65_09200 [Bacteroidales bacterium]|nr:hypothetical protein [Bacteroidales bacterium]
MDSVINNIQVNQNGSGSCCLSGVELPEGVTMDKSRCCKLSSNDWLKDIKKPVFQGSDQYIEVRFKNGRKEFFVCPPELNLKKGEVVAVEATPGHDIGIVELTGAIVALQMKRKRIDPVKSPPKKVYRHARSSDVEKWFEAFTQEEDALIRTRKIVEDLRLGMKLNDVEYQGDRTKAIFYYTADDRVDFRQLIRRLADEFKVRIEMRQIGVRQEAAKLGGIGSCGRELCCSSHMSHFKSVSTSSARVQQLSLNPQKLAGQCGKLKCCLNYELDNYVDILKAFPDNKILLKSKKGQAQHQKSDIFQKVMLYSYVDDPSSMLVIPVQQVKNIIDMNRKGKFPEDLESFAQHTEQNVSENMTDNLNDFTPII